MVELRPETRAAMAALETLAPTPDETRRIVDHLTGYCPDGILSAIAEIERQRAVLAELAQPVPVDLADDEPTEPARELPQIAVACPTCGAKPGELCTSHGGTRPRRYDTHVARTSAYAASKDGNQ